MQSSIINDTTPIMLGLADAEAWYLDAFIEDTEPLVKHLISSLSFRQDDIMMFGKPVKQPRLVCWMADEGIQIKYSGLRLAPEPWDGAVLALKEKVEKTTGATYNSVLINYYRDGQDSMGWHADDEVELGPDPSIASISLGAARKFSLKPKVSSVGQTNQAISLMLGDGSLLFMGQGCQRLYKHQLPKTTQMIKLRVNLTFRRMFRSG